jgi:hypothetical protein
MLGWGGKVPKREKDWAATEQQMATSHQRDIERMSPFHPEHWKVNYNWGGEPRHAQLAGNPCAPTYFAALK